MTTNSSEPQPPVTLSEALRWLAEMFDEPITRVHETSARTSLPGWDSLGQLVLMAALDERFGLRLTEAELSQLQSVADILTVLRRHGFLAA